MWSRWVLAWRNATPVLRHLSTAQLAERTTSLPQLAEDSSGVSLSQKPPASSFSNLSASLKGHKDPHGAVGEALHSGAAYERFEQFVRAQGGAPDALENLPVSATVREVRAPRSGHVTGFAALGVSRAALALGAGRRKKTDKIDPAAGVEILAKPGDRVEKGDPVARLHGDREAEEAERLILQALELGDEPPEPAPAILDDL
jgi:thymidine phosphorylase